MTTAVVVTGASRGFGRASAVALPTELAIQTQVSRIDLFLWARGESKLKETDHAVQIAAKRLSIDVRVRTIGVDLGDQASYVQQTEALVDQLQQVEYETVYIVHNAGSVGALGPAHTWTSARELASFWELNLNHVCYMNARLLAAFDSKKPTRLVLVNVSSNVAVTPFVGCGLYCTGKAAREMHFRVLAEENKDTNRVRVVNYWPGALDTQMQDELRESSAFPDHIHDVFVGFKEHGQLASAEESASYCAQVVVATKYASGETVAFDPAKLESRKDNIV